MKPEEKIKTIKEKVLLATEAVSSMPEGELKTKAFEVILNSLLVEGINETTSSLFKKSRNKKTSSETSPSKKTIKASPEKKSTLSFDLEQAQKLKEFYDRHAPSGRENTVFILAYFLKEIIKQDTFHGGDIQYVYNQLQSMKPKTQPPTMSLDVIKGTIRMLIAPTRKKQWIERSDEKGMYKLSPGGLNYANYELEEKEQKNHE